MSTNVWRLTGFETSVRGVLRRHAWGLFAVVVSSSIAVSYLLTHPYPAYGAGLYLHVAEQIRTHGYRLPEFVSLYTDTLPFAYPPLQFYLAAVVQDVTGVDPVTYARVVPAVVTVLYLGPYYALANEFTRTTRQAGFATLLLAASPPTLQWHLSAGGIVRAPAFFLALCGIYAGVQVFKNGSRQWVPVGLVLFALTALSHPVYTVFFGMTWLLFYLSYDRTLRGLVAGAVVAVGGVALAAPWWLQVIQTHGPGIFFAAAGTHSGLAGGLHHLLDQFVYPLDATVVTLFYVAAFAATAYFLYTGRYVLPAWLLAGAYVIGKERFQFVAGSIMVAVVVFDSLLPALARRVEGFERRHATLVLVAVLVVPSLVGVLYAGSALDSAHHGSTSQPQFVDAADAEAMQWAASNTPRDADFVVLGDQAEWFPLLTDRTILVGPWGVEWTSPQRYDHQLSLFKTLSTCHRAACLSGTLATNDVRPDYVYVPKGTYTVRGLEIEQSQSMRATLVASDRYVPVYENDGAVIFRVAADGAESAHLRAAAPDTGIRSPVLG